VRKQRFHTAGQIELGIGRRADGGGGGDILISLRGRRCRDMEDSSSPVPKGNVFIKHSDRKYSFTVREQEATWNIADVIIN